MGTVYKLKPNSRIWWVGYKNLEGKRCYESSGSELKTDAQTLLRAREGKIDQNENVTPKTHRHTLGDALDIYVSDLKMHRSPKVIRAAETNIAKYILKFFHRDMKLTAFTTLDMEKYKRWRLDAGAAKTSINIEVERFTRMFNLALEYKMLSSAPRLKRLDARDCIRKGFLEDHDLEIILPHLPAHIRPVMLVAYHTGWRVAADVVPLTVDRVDLKAG